MANTQKDLLKKALEFYATYPGSQNDNEVMQDQNYLIQKVMFFKEAAKAEGIGKSEYGLGLVAFVLNELKTTKTSTQSSDNTILQEFVSKYELPAESQTEIEKYMDFLHSERDETNKIEEVLRDAQYLHLGMPDALEKLEMQRVQEEQENNYNYNELEWLEKSKQYFIKHSFNCAYTIGKYGAARSKNFIELEKRIDKLSGSSKERNGSNSHSSILSDKEGEDMFKLAFRNSVNLISVADSKAGMLIQINTLLAGFVFTFGVAKFEVNAYYLIPTSAILIGSALTVFFGILASRPVRRQFEENLEYEKEDIFFGSYDRLDTRARKVSWEKYSSDINELLQGDKKLVFDGLIRESYEVSKVLSRKFGYLSLAYKIFFAGLLLGIVGFLVLIIYEYNYAETHAPGMMNANPF